MRKKCYRYFGSCLFSQEKWLNKMSGHGYRLVRVGKALYEFEKCEPNAYVYALEYIGGKSKSSAQKYKHFLEDLGYRVFYKNLNLQRSVGKVRWQPWAEKGGRLSTNATTIDKELLIIEKFNDGKPLELYSTLEDRIHNTRQMQKPWLFSFLISAACSLFMKHWFWLILSIFYLIPTVLFQIEIVKLCGESKTKEW